MTAPGRVLRLDVEYDGAGFSGWAHQPGCRTVEGVLRHALTTVWRQPVAITVAGRTDAGVHATGQVASTATASDMPAERIARGLAGILPHDVAVRRVSEAPPGFDARRDATARRYEYRLLLGPDSPLRRGRCMRCAGRSAAAMARPPGGSWAGTTSGVHAHAHRVVFFHRTVRECRWERRGDELVLVVAADAFLRGMVRTLAGTLLEVGTGRRRADDIGLLLQGATRSDAGPTLPAHALTLVAVTY